MLVTWGHCCDESDKVPAFTEPVLKQVLDNGNLLDRNSVISRVTERCGATFELRSKGEEASLLVISVSSGILLSVLNWEALLLPLRCPVLKSAGYRVLSTLKSSDLELALNMDLKILRAILGF